MSRYRLYGQKKKEIHPESCRRCDTPRSAKWVRFKNGTIHLRSWCFKCDRSISCNPLPSDMAASFGLHSKEEEQARQLVAHDVGGFLSE